MWEMCPGSLLFAVVLQYSRFVPALTAPVNSYRLDPLPCSMERDGIGLEIIPKWARACVSRTSRLRLVVCVGAEAEAEHQPKLSLPWPTMHTPPRTFYCLAEASIPGSHSLAGKIIFHRSPGCTVPWLRPHAVRGVGQACAAAMI